MNKIDRLIKRFCPDADKLKIEEFKARLIDIMFRLIPDQPKYDIDTGKTQTYRNGHDFCALGVIANINALRTLSVESADEFVDDRTVAEMAAAIERHHYTAVQLRKSVK